MTKELTSLSAWKALETHFKDLEGVTLRSLFAQNPSRAEHMTVEAAGIYFDYSKNRITKTTLKLLVQLAHESNLQSHIKAMFHGDKINVTEQRAVLHTALRAPKHQTILTDRENIVPKVHAVLDKMAAIATQIRAGLWLGFTGKPIKNIVNIGIGGSNLGPLMACEALKHYSHRQLTIRFISNIDGTDFIEKTQDLNPEETLFIICSKTFTTLETITNAQTARNWILQTLNNPKACAKHFIAVSTNAKEVAKFGIDSSNRLEFWDWVGGRYSMNSAIGLSTMIAIGPEHFHELLKGFHEMDEHFYSTPFESNLPVLMGLLTLWYNNFFKAQTVAILPYDQYLKYFPAYLQQLTMESNGKQVTLKGQKVNYQTGAIYWGEPGTDGQHSFYQLLHQGTSLVPCDFIAFAQSLNPIGQHHDLLMANVFAQSEALAFGRTAQEAEAQGIAPSQIPFCTFEGNRPSNTLLLEKLTPKALGCLIALYEHSVFTQGVLWQINSFDQWGVELGKTLAMRIIPELENPVTPELKHDNSTNTLIKQYRKLKKWR